ncbi:MAG: cell division protein FtsA [bacterium]|nr:cell division protein FtsA [bacterium]MDD5354014.1 cell division protein FtsA [bacterium]MDD5755917.1 cell division protein FtsA [bacterium]
MGKNNFVVGLDVGTSKISACIGQLNDNDQIQIIGVGQAVSEGVKQGMITDLERATKAVSKAVEEAEKISGLDISEVSLGVGGSHIKSQHSRGVIAISRTDKEITPKDVERVIDQARAIPVPLEQEVIDVLPQRYIIDDQDGIVDPIGMSGIRLETEVLIISGGVAAIQNMVKVVNKAGLRIKDLVVGSLAVSSSVLLKDEKELGVALVDIGGGKTDIAVFIEGNIRYLGSLPVGGELISKDIAFGLRTSFKEAEEIKKQYGWAKRDLITNAGEISVTGIGRREARKVPVEALVEIIEPRMEEILNIINREIQKSNLADLIPSGLIITGGASQLRGLEQFAEQVFGMPTRIGAPQEMLGMSSQSQNSGLALSMGLVQLSLQEAMESGRYYKKGKTRLFEPLERWKHWLEDIF